ncbi:MAG TPA: hypothetical protein VGL02_11475 [Streptomyces sp.]
MDLVAQLATVDHLRAREFPARRVRSGAVESGPGFHVADLEVSEDFWQDDGSRRPEVAEDFGAACQALVEILSRRWGDPRTLDLAPFQAVLDEGGTVPPPLEMLCGCLPEVYGWQVGERWIAVGVGQRDARLPFQLVVAMGERGVG